jgi:hypothetical protein
VFTSIEGIVPQARPKCTARGGRRHESGSRRPGLPDGIGGRFYRTRGVSTSTYRQSLVVHLHSARLVFVEVHWARPSTNRGCTRHIQDSQDLFVKAEDRSATKRLGPTYLGIESMDNAKLRAIAALHQLAEAGARHPDAISYAGSPDCFEHMRVLSLISRDRAEALRIHRELIAEDLIGAPRQTSRKQPDGTRRQLQVQRLFADRLGERLASDRRQSTSAAT